MIAFASWYILITLFGLAALPLAYTWLRHLPDRGWGVTRPLGWLLAGYLVWLLGALGGFAQVNAGTGLSALLIVSVVSLAVLQRWGGGVSAFVDWVRERRRLIAAEELLFFVAFLAWAYYRAHDNTIAATEKPMEFAFLNSIVRGGEIPPADPWLSGFAISYYYFGYLLVGLLTEMSGVATSVAFNLAVALLFALTATGGFSVAYNLVAALWPDEYESAWTYAGGFLGTIMLVVISNVEGVFEILHANGIGSPALYEWLDIKNLAGAPQSATWYPTDTWWWWRASRVIHDRVPITGADQEVIDEFPFFSFLLGDMHPHVLALPFALLALAVAFNLLRSAWVVADAGTNAEPAHWRSILVPFDGWQLGAGWGALSLFLSVLVVGSLGFLNSWDFPTYGFVLMASWVLGMLVVARAREWQVRDWLWDHIQALLVIPTLGIVLFLPFYLGFRSQAEGIGIVWANKTAPQQYFVFFGIFIWVLLGVLGAMLPAIWRTKITPWRVLVTAALAVPLAIGLFFGFGTVVITSILVALSAFALEACLSPRTDVVAERRAGRHPVIAGGSVDTVPVRQNVAPLMFALLLFCVSVLLTLGTEFFFIRDSFGTRMNTIFKLYYQAWIMMSMAAAFGAVWLVRRLPRLPRAVWGTGFVILLAVSLLYPVAATWTKAGRFAGEATLDGMAWFRNSPDFVAIQWLNENVEGQPVVLEATGGSYSEYARISMATGLPTVLGWDFHEQQWRGSYEEPGRRKPLIERMYTSTDPTEAKELLDQFDVRYVVIAPLERNTYNLTDEQIAKFREFMTPVVEQGNVIVFAR